MRADEGALRTFHDTTDVGDSRCSPRLVDKDWHAICEAIFQGVEGSEWKIMYCNDKELHEAFKCVKSGKQEGQGALVSEKTKDKGIYLYDLGNVQQIQTRSRVRLVLWAIHLQSPASALADALERTEQQRGPPLSSATSDV